MTRRRPLQRDLIVLEMGEEQRNQFTTLVANLLTLGPDEPNRVLEMGRYRIDPELLPPSLGTLRVVYQIILQLDSEHISTSMDNVQQRLALDIGQDEARKFVEDLWPCRTTPPLAFEMAFMLDDWARRQSGILASKQIGVIFTDPIGTYATKWGRAAGIIQSIAPSASSTPAVNEHDATEAYLATLEREADQRKKGIIIRPQLPWGLPMLVNKNLNVIAAKSSYGKTLIGMLAAKFIAYQLGDPDRSGQFDVLYLHFETEIDSFIRRSMAKWLKVTPNDFLQGKVDPRDKKWSEDVALYKASIAKAQKHGLLIYKHAAGMEPPAIRLEIEKHAGEAAARGRKLVVFIDYYNIIPWSMYSEETPRLNAMAEEMKLWAEKIPDVFILAFAQDDLEGDYGKRKSSAGGQNIYKRSQVFMRIHREIAKSDEMMFEEYEEDGKKFNAPMKDALGRQVFWHKSGELSSEASIEVVKGSDIGRRKINLKICNPFFTVIESPSSDKK